MLHDAIAILTTPNCTQLFSLTKSSCTKTWVDKKSCSCMKQETIKNDNRFLLPNEYDYEVLVNEKKNHSHEEHVHRHLLSKV